MLNDNELIKKAKAGDSIALDALMSRYKSLASKIARNYFLIGGDYDDLVQEAMIGLYKAYTSYDTSSKTSFSTFAHMCITRNVQSAIKIANRKKNAILNQSVDILKQSDTLVSPNPSPDEKLIQNENIESIKQNIQGSLSKFEQQVLSMFLKGYSYKDIATKLSVTNKSIDNALSRIRKKLSFLME